LLDVVPASKEDHHENRQRNDSLRSPELFCVDHRFSFCIYLEVKNDICADI
jgi:hypothetical protein